MSSIYDDDFENDIYDSDVYANLLEEENDNMLYYCFECEYRFYSKDEMPYCPECGSFDLDFYSSEECVEIFYYNNRIK